MIVVRHNSRVQGDLCRPCMRKYFRSFTLTTLFLGWWGTASFFITPFLLLNNVSRYVGAHGLAEPSVPLTGQASFSSPPDGIAVGESSRTLKIVYGSVMWIVVLGLAAYTSVGTVERYAPWLNSWLHNGEFSGRADSEYVGQKIFENLQALNEPPKDRDWSALRAAMLARKPYLDDLKKRNAALQRAVEKERGSLSGDMCEQIVVRHLAPALDSYTTAMDQLFSLASRAPELTQADAARAGQIAGAADSALGRMKGAFDERRSRGCDE
jgi:hypothetical protein